MAAILTGLSIERSDYTGVWDTPYSHLITELEAVSIAPSLAMSPITVLDEDGNAISGATITVEDANGTQVQSTTTDSNGIATVKRLQHADQPITFTVSKSGYQTTKIIDTITEKIDWRVTLLDWSIVPAEDQVKHGVVYANNTKTGIFKGDVHILDGETSGANIKGNVEGATVSGETDKDFDGSVEGASIEGEISGNDNISGDVSNG